MKRKTNLIGYIEKATLEFTAALLRVVFIFVFLMVSFDSMTRLYYSYMPISTWIKFNDLTVKNDENGIPTIYVERETVGKVVTVFHRTLFVLYPENTRACTASVIAVIDNPEDRVISLPLERAVSESCPQIMKDRTIDAVLQVSYLFDFPFGVKRHAVRYSNRFSVTHDGERYRIGSPIRTAR